MLALSQQASRVRRCLARLGCWRRLCCRSVQRRDWSPGADGYPPAWRGALVRRLFSRPRTDVLVDATVRRLGDGPLITGRRVLGSARVRSAVARRSAAVGPAHMPYRPGAAWIGSPRSRLLALDGPLPARLRSARCGMLRLRIYNNHAAVRNTRPQAMCIGVRKGLVGFAEPHPPAHPLYVVTTHDHLQRDLRTCHAIRHEPRLFGMGRLQKKRMSFCWSEHLESRAASTCPPGRRLPV